MEPVTSERFALLEKKVEAIYVSVEKTRKYFFWTMVITIGALVLPLIGLAFAIPSFVNTYATQLNAITP
jgi:hypothetical protein